jgi:hypothetical protein
MPDITLAGIRHKSGDGKPEINPYEDEALNTPPGLYMLSAI